MIKSARQRSEETDSVLKCQLLSLFLPTAREGNVFRSVCHSVHREVSTLTPLPLLWTETTFRLSIDRDSSPPLNLDREPPWRQNPPPPLWRKTTSWVLTSDGGHCSSQYECMQECIPPSYWNAFLFSGCIFSQTLLPEESLYNEVGIAFKISDFSCHGRIYNVLKAHDHV